MKKFTGVISNESFRSGVLSLLLLASLFPPELAQGACGRTVVSTSGFGCGSVKRKILFPLSMNWYTYGMDNVASPVNEIDCTLQNYSNISQNVRLTLYRTHR